MTEKTTKQIANKLKQARLEKGLTQVEIAQKAGINANYYAKVERGELNPSAERLGKIIKALGVGSSVIFSY